MKLCSVLGVSRSSYYAWDKRPESNRSKANKILLEKIKNIHNESKKVYGSIKIRKKLNDGKNPPVNHKRIERIMSKNGIKSKVTKKFKATTNSNHKLPVAQNILNGDFSVEKPNEKMVSDITYVWTNEEWLYVAAIMDLSVVCRAKVTVGIMLLWNRFVVK